MHLLHRHVKRLLSKGAWSIHLRGSPFSQIHSFDAFGHGSEPVGEAVQSTTNKKVWRFPVFLEDLKDGISLGHCLQDSPHIDASNTFLSRHMAISQKKKCTPVRRDSLELSGGTTSQKKGKLVDDYATASQMKHKKGKHSDDNGSELAIAGTSFQKKHKKGTHPDDTVVELVIDDTGTNFQKKDKKRKQIDTSESELARVDARTASHKKEKKTKHLDSSTAELATADARIASRKEKRKAKQIANTASELSIADVQKKNKKIKHTDINALELFVVDAVHTSVRRDSLELSGGTTSQKKGKLVDDYATASQKKHKKGKHSDDNGSELAIAGTSFQKKHKKGTHPDDTVAELVIDDTGTNFQKKDKKRKEIDTRESELARVDARTASHKKEKKTKHLDSSTAELATADARIASRNEKRKAKQIANTASELSIADVQKKNKKIKHTDINALELFVVDAVHTSVRRDSLELSGGTTSQKKGKLVDDYATASQKKHKKGKHSDDNGSELAIAGTSFQKKHKKGTHPDDTVAELVIDDTGTNFQKKDKKRKQIDTRESELARVVARTASHKKEKKTKHLDSSTAELATADARIASHKEKRKAKQIANTASELSIADVQKKNKKIKHTDINALELFVVDAVCTPVRRDSLELSGGTTSQKKGKLVDDYATASQKKHKKGKHSDDNGSELAIAGTSFQKKHKKGTHPDDTVAELVIDDTGTNFQKKDKKRKQIDTSESELARVDARTASHKKEKKTKPLDSSTAELATADARIASRKEKRKAKQIANTASELSIADVQKKNKKIKHTDINALELFVVDAVTTTLDKNKDGNDIALELSAAGAETAVQNKDGKAKRIESNLSELSVVDTGTAYQNEDKKEKRRDLDSPEHTVANAVTAFLSKDKKGKGIHNNALVSSVADVWTTSQNDEGVFFENNALERSVANARTALQKNDKRELIKNNASDISVPNAKTSFHKKDKKAKQIHSNALELSAANAGAAFQKKDNKGKPIGNNAADPYAADAGTKVQKKDRKGKHVDHVVYELQARKKEDKEVRGELHREDDVACMPLAQPCMLPGISEIEGQGVDLLDGGTEQLSSHVAQAKQRSKNGRKEEAEESEVEKVKDVDTASTRKGEFLTAAKHRSHALSSLLGGNNSSLDVLNTSQDAKPLAKLPWMGQKLKKGGRDVEAEMERVLYNTEKSSDETAADAVVEVDLRVQSSGNNAAENCGVLVKVLVKAALVKKGEGAVSGTAEIKHAGEDFTVQKKMNRHKDGLAEPVDMEEGSSALDPLDFAAGGSAVSEKKSKKRGSTSKKFDACLVECYVKLSEMTFSVTRQESIGCVEGIMAISADMLKEADGEQKEQKRESKEEIVADGKQVDQAINSEIIEKKQEAFACNFLNKRKFKLALTPQEHHIKLGEAEEKSKHNEIEQQLKEEEKKFSTYLGQEQEVAKRRKKEHKKETLLRQRQEGAFFTSKWKEEAWRTLFLAEKCHLHSSASSKDTDATSKLMDEASTQTYQSTEQHKWQESHMKMEPVVQKEMYAINPEEKRKEVTDETAAHCVQNETEKIIYDSFKLDESARAGTPLDSFSKEWIEVRKVAQMEPNGKVVDADKWDHVGATKVHLPLRNYNELYIVLDLNGVLIKRWDKNPSLPGVCKKNRKWIQLRPGCIEFLQKAFSIFRVGIWSTMTHTNVLSMCKFLEQQAHQNLPFFMLWSKDLCYQHRGVQRPDKAHVVADFKPLSHIWRHFYPCLGFHNTILVDDSPYKACMNNPCNCIFPDTFDGCTDDNYLNEVLWPYLERMRMSCNIQAYIANNRLGQQPITVGHELYYHVRPVMQNRSI